MEQGELGEEVLSMVDVLQEDNELEAEANAVLGDSDDQHCTYSKGYVNRQALYACSTCTPPTAEPAGICLACCLTCHESHELVELYTKRNFRCDCGNSKFDSQAKCKLNPDKEERNTQNVYNQNFKGLYCTCHKPYPDPDDDIEDDMIQCVICEDWYHSRHLGALPPAGGEYQEMTCDACVEKCPFLQAYLCFSVPRQTCLGSSLQVVTKEEKEVAVNVVEDDEKPSQTTESAQNTNEKDDKVTATSNKAVKPAQVEASSLVQHKRELTNHEGTKSGSDGTKVEKETTETGCKLVHYQNGVNEIKNTSAYWNESWRTELCHCTDCKALYSTLGVSFLLDEQDTMVAYEERGKQSQTAKLTAYESGMQALEGMGRINQVEALHGYNDMKNELVEFFRDFADQGKVVTSDDIKSFFESMQSRKRQRTGSANTIQYQCK